MNDEVRMSVLFRLPCFLKSLKYFWKARKQLRHFLIVFLFHFFMLPIIF